MLTKRRFLLVFLAISLVVPAMAHGASEGDTARYIVVFEDSVTGPAALARAQTEQHDAKLGFVYRNALEGYSAILAKDEVEELRSDRRVKYVSRDHRLKLYAQTTPTGVERVFAASNDELAINEADDLAFDVDVAVIDSGVDEHPDLNVVGRTDCATYDAGSKSFKCSDGSGADYLGHGTHVAGTIGALDNDKGVVGTAPGARIWSVRVFLLGSVELFESSAISGVDWVAAHSSQIEVANMSFGCTEEIDAGCNGLPGLENAITKAAQKGIVFVAAAGNEGVDAEKTHPASHPDVITVSALADYDGLSGGVGTPTCGSGGEDDHLAGFSNYGATVEVAAPGVCIFSTVPGNGYGYNSGTSMAAPHVTGAAALLASKSNPNDLEDVEAIRDTIVDEGHDAEEEKISSWVDTSGDGVKEPVLYMGDEAVFAPMPAVALTEGAEVKSTTEAVVKGKALPNGVSTSYQFEYGKTTSYGTSVPVPGKGIGSGFSFVSVSEALKGLEADTTYHYRLAVTNSKGTFYGVDRTFHTAFPESTTGAATEVGPFSAKLNGTVNPKSSPTTYYFEYGETTSYGSKAPLKGAEAGSGSSNVAVSATALGLDPATTYHYRLVATNASGTTYGADRVVTTYDVALHNSEGLCEFENCSIAFDGEYRLENNLSQALCSHEFTLEFGVDGTVRASAHSAAAIPPAECLLRPCTAGEDATWNGRVVQYQEGVARIRLDTCIKGDGGGVWYNPLEFEYEVTEFEESALVAEPQTVPFGIFELEFSGEWLGADYVQFETAFVSLPPSVSTEGASDIASTSVVANGTVNPNGSETEYWFEYGTTTSLGSKIPVAGASVGEGTASVEVSETLEGLRQGATYFYRLVAESPEGLVFGGFDAFQTPPHSDVNGDARSDLVAVHSDQEARVVAGTASGFDGAKPTASLKGALDPALLDESGHYAVDVADVTGEGFADLITAETGGGVHVYPGKADRTFGSSVESYPGAKPLASGGLIEIIAVADVSGDGRADGVGFYATTNGFFFAPGKADGTFGTAVLTQNGTLDSALPDASGHYFLDVIDVTGDGRPDVVSIKTDGKAYVFKGAADGKFSSPVEAASVDPIMDNGVGEEPVGLGDVNADGRADLLTLSDTDGKLRLRLGNENGTFAAATTPYGTAIDSSLLDGSGQELVGLIDYSRDGRGDLVSVNSAGELLVYTAQTSATFAAPVTQGGSFPSTRLGSTGYEFATEKPMIRRVGCEAGGCVLP